MFRASPPKKHTETVQVQNLDAGLKTLIEQKEEKRVRQSSRHGEAAEIIHSYMVPKSPLNMSVSSSSSSIVLDSSCSSTSMGDLIGTESGVYMSSNEEELIILNNNNNYKPTRLINIGRRNINNAAKKKKKKEYPPPLPSLDRTLTRHYTSDGSLVLRDSWRVERRPYFHSHRENGRLILKLIVNPMDEHQQLEEDLDLDDEHGIERRSTVTYASGMFMDSQQLECPRRFLLDRSSSSPFPLRPMAAAM